MRAELQSLHASIPATRNARRGWSARHTVRLYLSDGSGHIGVGEAAPLPGVSEESAGQAREALARFEWPDEAPTRVAEIARLVARIDAGLPSARFAAETALAALATSKLHVPLYALFTDEVEEVPVATALFGADDRDVVERAREAAAEGAHAVKLKIGRSAPLDGWLVETVRQILPDAELRLDANRAIDPAQLEERVEALRGFDPAFIEEPSTLEATLGYDDSPIPFALDESLAGPDGDATLDRALASDRVVAVVLKPSLLGGLLRCHELARRARAAGRLAIVSHLLEGPIARAAAAHLALALGGSVAAGLGAHPALEPLSDGIRTPWIEEGWIVPPTLPGLGLELAS